MELHLKIGFLISPSSCSKHSICFKPRASTGAGFFAADCAADDACAGGIYTGETYDAITMIGKAYNMEQGANMDTHISLWLVAIMLELLAQLISIQ